MSSDPTRDAAGAGQRAEPPASMGMDVLRAVEADGAIFEPSLGDFSLWPVLRFSAWQLVSGVKTGETSGSGRALLRRLGRAQGLVTYGAWSLWKRRQLRARRFDFLFLSLEAHRLAGRAGDWWDPYLDDIALHPALAGRVLRIEHRDFPVSRGRTTAARHLFADLIGVDRIRRGEIARPSEAIDAASRTCDALFEKVRALGARIDSAGENVFRRRAVAMACRFLRERLWYEQLLREFRPSAVALVDAYNQHGLVAAARACRIPAVEFQHGSIHADHPGYVWFTPALACRERLPIPDRVATYGFYWSDVLTREGFWKPAEVPAVGSARIDRVRESVTRGASPLTRIVFTSQYATRRATIPLLEEFLRLAEAERLEHTLTIKVHRAEREVVHEYEALTRVSPRVRVVAPYEDDTLALIAGADVHVSGWSTCHYEAVALGTPTIVLMTPGPDRVAALAGFSSVFRAAGASELLEAVQRAHRAGAVEGTAWREESERLFRRGAVENAVAVLREYVPA